LPNIDPCGRAYRRALLGLLGLGMLLLPANVGLAQARPTARPAPGPNASTADAGLATADAPLPSPPPAPAAEVTPEPAPLPPPPPPIEEPHARLDYSDGVFYLRSANDNLVFVPGARAHIDLYTFGGPGVSDYHRANGTGLKTNLFFRRFVLEFGGLIRKKWFYWLGGNFAPTQVDSGQNPISTANVYDGFVGYIPVPQLRIYFGMYNAPFTMENVTSSRWLDMMERALIVRTVATPYNKAEGLMAWGDTKNKSFEYQGGIFGGDGMNRPNIDNRFDGMGRFVVRPLAKRTDALQRFHVGGGARYGRRDRDFVRYDAPNLTTPGGYAFWSAAYGSGATETHIMPDRKQWALAAEAYVPFTRWDVRGELVYVNEQRREALASDRTMTLRAGALTGYGTYAQVSYWLLGTARINGNPGGTYGVLKLPDGLGAQAPFALQLVLRGEWMRLNYDANSRSGDEGGWGSTNDITVNAYQLGLNYWATKHVRLTAEYSLYHFPGTPITAGAGADNLAAAPGARSGTEPDAKTLHEISFRVGLAL
jgi:phosphate-selective porin